VVAGRVSGRRCLVTGAANGLGRAFCVALAREGGLVAGLDVADLTDTAAEVSAAVSSGSGVAENFVPVGADVTSLESVNQALQLVDARLGGLDILVNNAGVYPVVPFEETSYQQWRQVMAVNLDGTFLVTRAALPALRRSSAGRIVNVASAVVWLGPPGMVAYTASKAGLIGFTRSLASELGPSGITVNAITPGMIPTDTAVRTGVTADLERVVAAQAVPRAEQPEDLISTLLFLVDEASGFVTGSAVNVDGGFAKH
jgi:3-oxoacyl-[acyl-carrier protein] reductase